MSDHSKEIECQYRSLKILAGGDINRITRIVDNGEIPALFRKIINHIENREDRVPEPEELIFITCRIIKKKKRDL